MKKDLTDRFYLLQKPSHSILTIIVVDSNFPIDEKAHDSLEKLKDSTDIIFVFDEKAYPWTKLISKKRFASLYGSKFWMSAGDGFLKGILKTFEYEQEVLKSHTSVLISNLSGLGEVTTANIEAIKNVNMSAITKPILKIERCSCKDYFDVYSKSGFRGIKETLFAENDMNRYCSYLETSRFTFLRPTITKIILEFCKNEVEKGYVESFSYPDFKYFFASLIKYLGLEYIEDSIEDVNIRTVGV